MKKLLIVNDLYHETKLHNNILDILFNHKREISDRFRDIKGIHFIDHVAIIIINPIYEITIFSYIPSVEYNLIVKDLWKHDKSFNPTLLKDGAMMWWDEAYYPGYSKKIQYIKEDFHNFSLGMNLIRKIEDYTFVYSFATRSKEKNMKAYYADIKNELFHIGDYGYNIIRDIYSRYCAPYIAPLLDTDKILKQKPHLKLIVNN